MASKYSSGEFREIFIAGIMAHPDDSDVSLPLLEGISQAMPPWEFGQVVLDDVTDIQEL